MKPSQRAREIEAFIALLAERDVRTYLEIGARYGQTLEAVGNALAVPSVLVVVEQPGSLWGRDDSWPVLEAVAERLRQKGHGVWLIQGNSQDPATAQQVREIQDTFDAVFIDADHRYEGVKKDWELYGPMARLVGFHDIAPLPRNHVIEVPRLWHELAKQYRTIEFCDPAEPGMGIGILFPREMR